MDQDEEANITVSRRLSHEEWQAHRTSAIPHVKGIDKLIDVFGYVPSFHDAEMLAFSEPQSNAEDGDVTFTFHTWETTGEVDEKGYFKIFKNTKVSWQFKECSHLRLKEFDSSILHGLVVSWDGSESYPFWVALEACWGDDGSFRCKHAEVVLVEPYEPESMRSNVRPIRTL